ncbi:MAG: hypothetical protein AB7W59_01320 [Acidimicrobiia bacterium]
MVSLDVALGLAMRVVRDPNDDHITTRPVATAAEHVIGSAVDRRPMSSWWTDVRVAGPKVPHRNCRAASTRTPRAIRADRERSDRSPSTRNIGVADAALL